MMSGTALSVSVSFYLFVVTTNDCICNYNNVTLVTGLCIIFMPVRVTGGGGYTVFFAD